jgi:hypothetical protein
MAYETGTGGLRGVPIVAFETSTVLEPGTSAANGLMAGGF